MTPLRLCLLALGGLTITACASTPDVLPVTAADQGAPVPLADHDWFTYGDDEAVRLTYGRDESDDVWVSLNCASGSGMIDVEQYLAFEGDPRIALESGGDTESWPARTLPDEMTDGVLLTAQVPADHPVFLRFRRLGWLASWGSEGRAMMAAHPGSRQGVERFFATCG